MSTNSLHAFDHSPDGRSVCNNFHGTELPIPHPRQINATKPTLTRLVGQSKKHRLTNHPLKTVPVPKSVSYFVVQFSSFGGPTRSKNFAKGAAVLLALLWSLCPSKSLAGTLGNRPLGFWRAWVTWSCCAFIFRAPFGLFLFWAASACSRFWQGEHCF